MLHAFFTKNNTKHIKISPWLQLNHPSLSKRSTGCTRQDLGIHLSVTHMLHVNQDSHGVGRCVTDESCSSRSLSESQWTVLTGYLTISTNVDAIKHSTDDNFSLKKTALCVQHSPTAAALSTNTAFEWKMWFSCFPVLPGSAEAQVIWGSILKHLLIAYFIGNISAKKYQNLFSCVSKL